MVILEVIVYYSYIKSWTPTTSICATAIFTCFNMDMLLSLMYSIWLLEEVQHLFEKHFLCESKQNILFHIFTITNPGGVDSRSVECARTQSFGLYLHRYVLPLGMCMYPPINSLYRYVHVLRSVLGRNCTCMHQNRPI